MTIVKIKRKGGYDMYKVTKEFTNGTLKGMTYTFKTKIKFEIGWLCARPCAGDSYKIISVEEIESSITP